MTDAARRTILMSDPILKLMGEGLKDQYEVLQLWDFADLAALAAGPGQAIEAIVYAGETKLPPDFIDALSSLKLIACVSVGYDGVNVPRARARGVEVTHASFLNADDVADHAMGLTIAAWKGILAGHDHLMAGKWEAGERLRPFGSLTGKTLGVVGLGHIGEGVARRAEAFGMKVQWWAPRAKDAAWPRAASLLALAQASDVLVVAARADESNRGSINREIIEAVGKRGLIVNVSRGWVIDEDELIAALKDRRLGMAALDVFAEEPTHSARWADVPNVVLTPHAAGSSAETVVRLRDQAVENMRRLFAGEPLLSPAPQ
jgi:lactate dehydrogenase-like 2-hydroxyacid dehydrogenase